MRLSIWLAVVAGVYSSLAPPALAQAPAARIEEGKVLDYRKFDPAGAVPDDLPALTIEDLRKITMYSELKVSGAELQVAGAKHVRKIEPTKADPSVLAVTSDHFRFTVLRNGVIDLKEIPKERQSLYRFLWVKHPTRESPDGSPWLKDLLLFPFDPKTQKLVGRWPFTGGVPSMPSRDYPSDEFFLDDGDYRPAQAKAPRPEECVVGVLQAGKSHYLVLDVFANLTWWGKVTQLEFAALRGSDKARLDEFHREEKKNAPFDFQHGASIDSKRKLTFSTLAPGPQASREIAKKLPMILGEPAKFESPAGFEDLLRLEDDGKPVAAIDAEITGLQTFVDLLNWAATRLERQSGNVSPYHWDLALGEAEQHHADGSTMAARIVRYGFRRMGYPAQIFAVCDGTFDAVPRLFVHVYVPKWRLSLVSWYDRGFLAFQADSAPPYTLSQSGVTKNGKFAVFEVPLGGRLGRSKTELGLVPVPR